MSLDDFPKRDDNSELAEAAESEFAKRVRDVGKFVVQQRDRRDYGTDFQIEARLAGGMTNYRVHAQVKGTDKAANRDGSVSIAVERRNLNYLLSQPHSIYVCYHRPTEALLVRSAEDVYRDAEHRGEAWWTQDALTIRFRAPFDATFQATLHARVVATCATLRDDRLHWVAQPPDRYHEKILTSVPTIHVPESPREASAVLLSLYERHENAVISKAFKQFVACLGAKNPRLIYAYLAEIDLAMRGEPFDRKRVEAAIAFIDAIQEREAPDTSRSTDRQSPSESLPGDSQPLRALDEPIHFIPTTLVAKAMVLPFHPPPGG